MTEQKFNEIIDFAVEREREAVSFYHDLQKIAKFSAQVEMLKEFEDMERGHIKILENMRKKGFENIGEKQVPDLKISDYIVEVAPSANMDYQDILIVAMKKEESANKLYRNMASKFQGTDLETLFNRLAAEEAQHKNQFERLYDEEVLKDN